MAGAKTPEEMEGCLGAFFKERGAGKYALYRAFRLSGEGEEMRVSPIRGRIDLKLSDLVG